MWTEQSRGRMAKIAKKTKRYPSDLTDEEWADPTGLRLVPEHCYACSQGGVPPPVSPPTPLAPSRSRGRGSDGAWCAVTARRDRWQRARRTRGRGRDPRRHEARAPAAATAKAETGAASAVPGRSAAPTKQAASSA